MSADMDATLAATYENLKGSFENINEPDNKDYVGEDNNEEPVIDAKGEKDNAQLDEQATVIEDNGEEKENPGNIEDKPSDNPPKKNKFQPHWKKEALSEYDKLPDIVKSEIQRREGDFHKGIEKYKADAAIGKDLDRAARPYMATINSLGVTPVVAAEELFKADHLLRYSAPQQKVQMLLKVAGDYGIDVNMLAQGLQNIAGEAIWKQQNPVDPQIQHLHDQINQLKHHINSTQQQASNAESSAIDAQIAEFAADPNHEHFEVLQRDMAILLQNGLAKDLNDAYEMAMRQNPQTYQIWLAEQQSKWANDRKAQIAKAKQIGNNVVKPNGRASGQKVVQNRSIEQDIEAKARELGLFG